MIACSLFTPGMAVGVELNPAPGDGVGEGDGLGAARTTISARFMRAGLSQTWRRRRRSGWRPARRPPPDGSVGRARPAVGSAAGTRARRAPARRGRRRRSAGAERRPAAMAGARHLLTGVYAHVWPAPYVPEYRLLTRLPAEPCPPTHPAVADVLAAIRSAASAATSGKGPHA